MTLNFGTFVHIDFSTEPSMEIFLKLSCFIVFIYEPLNDEYRFLKLLKFPNDISVNISICTDIFGENDIAILIL